jgi:protein-S-isoprenylcysteine O-methyltransferase Ste14
MLPLGDLLVFLDYGHWHLMPALRQRGLQMTGLVLYACAVAVLMWTDTYLARHFQGDSGSRQLMTIGPFSIVRHPRYAGLLLAKLGFSLLFASIFGWISLLVSILLIRRRIRLEEIHLHESYGPGYASYTARTRRLLPGIY